MQANCAADTHT